MKPVLTFIVPVRHQDNARDWSALKANLSQTVASISSQTAPDWRGIVVANEGADLPTLPDNWDVVRVAFPPNEMHEQSGESMEDFYDAFRVDKGRRVLAGMLAARTSRFFMIVDDDDFVSSRLAQHAAEHPDANGWTIDRGYIWDDGGRLLLEYDDFSHLCGTSLIVRSDLYGLPESQESASLEWIRNMLGSHIRIAAILAERGTPLEPLPFRGAVYRVAHRGSHSQARSLLYTYFVSPEALRQPGKVIRNLGKLRWLNRGVRGEFFGDMRWRK